MHEKIRFLSTFDENSPFFLRLAQDFLLKNDPHSAIVVLKKGLKKFPDHPVAYILLGKAFLQSRNHELADSNFMTASNIINSKRTYDYYSNEIKNADRFKVNRESFANIHATSYDSRTKDDLEKRKDQLSDAKAMEDRLEQLASELSSARIQRVKEIDLTNSNTMYNIPERSKIISETLAKIYLSQGELNEAIKVYEKLIKKDPMKESYYSEKIREIRSS